MQRGWPDALSSVFIRLGIVVFHLLAMPVLPEQVRYEIAEGLASVTYTDNNVATNSDDAGRDERNDLRAERSQRGVRTIFGSGIGLQYEGRPLPHPVAARVARELKEEFRCP